ncbi:hypothetical protein GCM10010517_58220 [Streptosporangium fragile]|uniref:Uncharacterized protein n=1 Tax=Streptosporangium fragile TaxID=46186 RepID=A0ABN3W4V1_9ACTN
MLVLIGGMTVLAVVDAVPRVRLALGQTGTSGTMTVSWCDDPGSDGPRRRCEGTFVSDATGEAVVAGAVNTFEPGDVYSAQLTPDGGRAVLRGVRYALADLRSSCTGLFILAMILAIWIRPLTRTVIVATSAMGTVGLVGWIAGWIASLG